MPPPKLHRREGFPSASPVHAFPGTGTRPHSFKPPKTAVNKLGCWVGSELQESETVCFQGGEKGRKESLTIKAFSWISHPAPHPALQHLPDPLSGRTDFIPLSQFEKKKKKIRKGMVKQCLQVMPFLFLCVFFLFHHLLLLQREKQTAFRAMFPLKNPALGLCFSSTGARRGRNSVCRDFSHSGSSEGAAPLQHSWLWRKHL